MEKLLFNIEIKASAAKVWQVLWNDITYRKWTSVFHEGSHAVSDWKEGSRIHFLGPGGSGMFSEISSLIEKEKMIFTHLGEVKNYKELELSDWKGATEAYFLSEQNGITTLRVELDATGEFKDYFENTFPKAIAIVKELAENPIRLTIETVVDAPVEKAWEIFNTPEHVTKWNAADPSWHSPRAQNDLRVGGSFNYRMEAKDGSFGFDFCGVYTVVEPNKIIEYSMEDGRKVSINFSSNGNSTTITEHFDAETENPLELQQGGWQSILNNFKTYCESTVHA